MRSLIERSARPFRQIARTKTAAGRGVNAGDVVQERRLVRTRSAEPRSVFVPELVTASVTVASASPNSAENWLVSTCTSRMLSSP